MGSEHGDSKSFKPSDNKPCANDCGFFGTSGKMNLCSKCYREFCLQKQSAVSAKSATKKTLVLYGGAAVTPSSSSPATQDSTSLGSPSAPLVPSNRCWSCNKKVGLTGFLCKCGATFCGIHRYPEKHDCSYDFKGAGRDAISKANPAVKGNKIQRF